MKGNLRKDSVGSDFDDYNEGRKRQSQFAFVERATQTMNNAMKVSRHYSNDVVVSLLFILILLVR